ncbi:MAG: peptidoglycan-binding protein [Bacilli bacterium]
MLSINYRLANLKYYYNYYKGNIDGVEGILAKQAYTKFQKDFNLKVDGIYGSETNNKLVEVVKDLQNKLNNNGYNLSVDGEIGPKTIKAIKDFQIKNNLIADNIAGVNTFNKLNNSSKYMLDNDWNNTKYFKKEEFKCPCGKCNGYGLGIYKSLIRNMENMREKYGRPIYISSGYRCQTYNDSLEGSTKTSKHVFGRACDFYISNYTESEETRNKIVAYAKTLPEFNYAYHNLNNQYRNMGSAIHFDVK